MPPPAEAHQHHCGTANGGGRRCRSRQTDSSITAAPPKEMKSCSCSRASQLRVKDLQSTYNVLVDVHKCFGSKLHHPRGRSATHLVVRCCLSITHHLPARNPPLPLSDVLKLGPTPAALGRGAIATTAPHQELLGGLGCRTASRHLHDVDHPLTPFPRPHSRSRPIPRRALTAG